MPEEMEEDLGVEDEEDMEVHSLLCRRVFALASDPCTDQTTNATVHVSAVFVSWSESDHPFSYVCVYFVSVLEFGGEDMAPVGEEQGGAGSRGGGRGYVRTRTCVCTQDQHSDNRIPRVFASLPSTPQPQKGVRHAVAASCAGGRCP